MAEPEAGLEPSPPTGPLAGIRIVDLTTVIMGPMATMMLGEMGADVIKVEPPAGDQTREYPQTRNQGMSAAFLNLNRNKRSIVLDLKAPDGGAAMRRLLEKADVFLYSVRPQAMQRLGLDYETCRALNPRLVYCGACGFRQDGPYAAKPAYDDMIQGLSGLTASQAWTCGEPRYMPTMACDKTTGLYVVNAITAALFHRERTGEGQAVEVPMFEANVHFNLMDHIGGMLYVPPVGEAGYQRAKFPNRRPYRTRDGYLCIIPGSFKYWQALFRALGRPELAEDSRVTDPATRYRSTDALYGLIAELVADWDTEDLMRVLAAADVPHGPVNTFDDLPNDPHLDAVGYFRHIEHPTEGPIMVPDIPVQFKASPGGQSRPAPCLGEHSVELLREAGYSAAEIDRMIGDGVTIDGGG